MYSRTTIIRTSVIPEEISYDLKLETHIFFRSLSVFELTVAIILFSPQGVN